MTPHADGPVPSEPTRYTTPPAPQRPPTDGHFTLSDRDLPQPQTETVYPDVSPAAGAAVLRIGDYEVLEELGRGGMGVVYRARHRTLGHEVALKMVLSGAHADAAELARFQLEAAAVARLHHAAIVHIHEFGTHDGKPFFSLELVDGGSLKDRLRKGPLPPRDTATLVEKLARAMQHAHEAGIVHRDLKPANVLLTRKGEPKVADFGLAKQMAADAGLSQTGNLLGTPSYMAPEQAAGKVRAVGPATDVYALGVILYECLTGQVPFRAPTSFETMQQVLTQEPVPPRRLVPGLPRDLETVCLRCLEKEAGKRYQSAADLADDLGRFLRGEPVAARRVGRAERVIKWARRHPAPAALLGVILLALVALSVLSGSLVVARNDAENKSREAEKQTGIALGKEQEARREADKARKARAFLVSIFNLSNANGQRNLTARQILDEAAKRIPEQFADQPELRDGLLADIETAYDELTARSPLAMILECSGTVQLHSTRDPKQRAVPQTLLHAGDRLSLAADGHVQLLLLFDWHKERLRPGTEVTIRRKGCEPVAAVSERDHDPMLTFKRLPKGTFYMGWGGEQVVQTEIGEDFEIAVHDVTQGQWEAVMGDNPSYFSRFGGGRLEVKDISDEELKLFPVESVSWEEVQKFITKLNLKEIKRGGGYLYRLPTEAEWEYACRGGALAKENGPQCSYHFYLDKPTYDLSSYRANFNGNYPFGNASRGPFLQRPTRVGAYPPNQLGLCDMHGNVRQWCDDLEDEPREGSFRVVRGGSWRSPGESCRVASRGRQKPSEWSNALGVRLARVPVR